MRRIISFLIIVSACAAAFFAGRTYYISNKEHTYLPWTADDELNYIDKLLAKGLNGIAAQEMEKYIEEYRGSRKELANTCYRLGSIYMKLYEYREALKYFYRAEMLDKNADFSEDMNRKIVEALENLGMGSQANYELEARTSLVKPAVDKVKVVASIGKRKIDENEIDKAINSLPKNMRGQFKESSRRAAFIKQYVTTEALYEKAKRMGIDKIPSVKESVEEDKKQIVVQSMIEKEIDKKLVADPSDVELYYEANKDRYIERAKAKVRYIEVSNKDDRKKVVDGLKSGKGKSEWVYEGDTYIGGIGKAEDVIKRLLSQKKGSTVGPVGVKDKSYIFIVEENSPRRQKAFDEVKNQVEYEYKMKKRKEIVDSIIKNTMEEENVEMFDGIASGEKSNAE